MRTFVLFVDSFPYSILLKLLISPKEHWLGNLYIIVLLILLLLLNQFKDQDTIRKHIISIYVPNYY